MRTRAYYILDHFPDSGLKAFCSVLVEARLCMGIRLQRSLPNLTKGLPNSDANK